MVEIFLVLLNLDVEINTISGIIDFDLTKPEFFVHEKRDKG